MFFGKKTIHAEIDNQNGKSINNKHKTFQERSMEKAFLEAISMFAKNEETCVRNAWFTR